MYRCNTYINPRNTAGCSCIAYALNPPNFTSTQPGDPGTTVVHYRFGRTCSFLRNLQITSGELAVHTQKETRKKWTKVSLLVCGNGIAFSHLYSDLWMRKHGLFLGKLHYVEVAHNCVATSAFCV